MNLHSLPDKVHMISISFDFDIAATRVAGRVPSPAVARHAPPFIHCWPAHQSSAVGTAEGAAALNYWAA